jgi:hypothetical protein
MNISVAMSTYNGAGFLREQLDSIAKQTHQAYELIVCDDASQDDSVSIVEKFAASVSFPVRIHANSKNLGFIKNFEQAIDLTSGDVIALCDHDDVWLPTKLARVNIEFDNAKDVGLVFSDAEVVNEDLSATGLTLWQKVGLKKSELANLQAGNGFDSLLPGATVTGATAAFHSRYKELVLPIPDDLTIIHDAWIAALIAAVTRVVPVPECLIKYRQHSAQQVGALERKNSRDGSNFISATSEALRRENPYRQTLATAVALRKRLLEHQDKFDSAKVMPSLEARIAHLQLRSELTNNKSHRPSRVVRELLTGRYHRYSKGFRSAAKDLLE